MDFDSADVRYFRLFPRVDSLRSFIFSAAAYPDSIAVEARRFSLPDTVFSISTSVAVSLAGYVDNFEAIFTGRHSVEWESIASYMSPVRPMLELRSIEVTMPDGSTQTGILFTAADSLLLLYTGERPDDWTTYAGKITVVPYHQIAEVNGRYIGGSHEMYTSSLPYLHEYMLFWGAIPPECSALARAAIVGAPSPVSDARPLDQIVEDQYLRRWHITPTAGASHMAVQFGISRALGAPTDPEHDVRRYASYAFAGIDIYYSLSRRFHVGVLISTLPAPPNTGHVLTRNVLDMKHLQGWTVGCAAMYSILAISPQLDEPLEWKVGGGVLYNFATVTTRRSVFDDSQLNSPPVRLGSSRTYETDAAVGVFISTTLEYFFMPSLSVRLSGEAAAGDTIGVKTNSTMPGEDMSIPPVTTRRKTSLDINRLNLTIGVGIHL